jgi:GntR family histidine utilization transcriptional repressor
MTDSPYQLIKRSIADGIASGQWRPGDALPSEMALTRKFHVSRMTVNRAMRELANENLIRRVPGVGSFVAEPVARSALVEIRNIAEEIAARGNRHAARILCLRLAAASMEAAQAFDLAAGAPLFHSEILHLEDGVPLQLEDRLVNPAVAPGYLDQDFTSTTPNAFLTRVAPLQQGAHQVHAVRPTQTQADLLQLAPDEPCLLVVRHTWSRGKLASLAHLYHPGERFALAGHFSA